MTTIPFKGKDKTIDNATIWTADQTYTITRGQYTILTIPKGSTVKQFETTNKGWTLWREANDDRWHVTGE